MKRKLTFIMVLALLISALSGIAVFGSAAEAKQVTYHYKFDNSKAAFWAVGQVFNNNADMKDLKPEEKDGVLYMKDTAGVRDWNTIGYYLGGKDKIQGTRFGFSVEFTLPEAGMAEGSDLHLLVPLTGGGSIDNGVNLKDGVLSAGPEAMDVITELENGKTYTAEMIYDFTVKDWPVIDTYIYNAEGAVVAKSEARMDSEMAPYFEGHLHSIGFRIYNQGENPVVLDNFKVFKLVEAEEYTVTVNGGTANVKAAVAGATVTVTADAAPEGKVFDKWVGEGVTFTDATSATTTFTMLESNVTVTATYKTAGSAVVDPSKKVTYHYQFDNSKAAFWAVGQVFNNNADMKDLKPEEKDGVLYLKETAGIRDWNTIGYYLGGKDKIKGTQFGFSVEFTLPEAGMAEGSKLYLLIPLTGGGAIDGGLNLKDGVLSAGDTALDMNADLENGKTYTAEMIYDFTVEGWPVIHTYVYNADGEVVAKNEDRAGNEYHENHMHSIGFSVYDQGANPVVVDNFKVFKFVEAEPAPTYTVTVTEGTANVNAAAAGATVTVTANAAPEGKVFDKWVGEGVTFANAASATTTFTMPESNVTVTATYKDAPVVAEKYTVTVNGVETEYAAGATVTVNAGTKEGFDFAGWTVSGVQVSDANAASITFTMPEGDVVLTANWSPKTGDNFSVVAIAALAIFSAMGMAVISFRKKEI